MSVNIFERHRDLGVTVCFFKTRFKFLTIAFKVRTPEHAGANSIFLSSGPGIQIQLTNENSVCKTAVRRCVLFQSRFIPKIFPMAMVLSSSRMVKRPMAGIVSYVSMHVLMGICKIAVHTCPCRAKGRTTSRPFSTTLTSFLHTTSISAVWTCMTAVYPGV
jgi:hypothetical protein